MRVMNALGLCATSEPEKYIATDKSASMIHPIGRDGVPCIFDLTVPTLSKLPEYFRLHGYRNPQEYSTSPMKWAVGKSQFEWLAENKLHQDLFNSYMSSRREGRLNWFIIYPIERLMTGAVAIADAVFLVDIGGESGA
ncbi:O-methyltransferase [Penicillium manginii]|uniref:O-methyltransferase n=1 Tax=Penicillium manginii TaxID=203109 RepID=UPI00254959A5|nr:O-methyltransferase [Penicillium manginii]KAJ5743292.1 O-methyltransferase [Penicillium manginii]